MMDSPTINLNFIRITLLSSSALMTKLNLVNAHTLMHLIVHGTETQLLPFVAVIREKSVMILNEQSSKSRLASENGQSDTSTIVMGCERLNTLDNGPKIFTKNGSKNGKIYQHKHNQLVRLCHMVTFCHMEQYQFENQNKNGARPPVYKNAFFTETELLKIRWRLL